MSAVARRLRLSRPAQFVAALKNGRRERSRILTLVHFPNGGAGARLGLSLARKNAPLAVVRNRLRRVLRDAFRAEADSLPAADFVVLSGPGVSWRKQDGALARADFRRLLARARARAARGGESGATG